MIFLSRFSYITAAILLGFTLSLNAQSEQSCVLEQQSCFYDNYQTSYCCDTGCCNNYSEVYLGALGFGTRFEVGHSGIGLDDYFGSGKCHNHNDGSLWGIVLGYTYRNPCNFYANAEFDWATGDVTGSNHFIGDFPNRSIDYYVGTGRLGYNFRFWNCFLVTPYGGIGYRYLKHHVHHAGLSYSNWFGIVGGRIDWQFRNCITIGFDGQGFIPFDSTVKLNNFCRRIDVGNGYGYQFELPISLDFPCYCHNFSLTLAPFYRKIEYGRSKYKTFDIETVRVPSLIEKDYGAKLYIGWQF